VDDGVGEEDGRGRRQWNGYDQEGGRRGVGKPDEARGQEAEGEVNYQKRMNRSADDESLSGPNSSSMSLSSWISCRHQSPWLCPRPTHFPPTF
jgi:hypothetical protein